MSKLAHVPLRPFQKRVFDHIMNGRSVILQAPTGAGKTRAALAPFIYNLACQEKNLPWTCRYAVPMRVLANQFYREYQSIASNIDREAATRLVDTYRKIGREAISIQTGEQSDDPQMEAALTFCTIDQLLASFLSVPYGIDGIRANLNVGAVIGSYLVLDEFHLYPLIREGKSFYGARTTTIEMLRLLKSITPFVLMTATFSNSLLTRLQKLLGAEVELITDEYELKDIAQGRARTFELSDLPMNPDTILEQHQDCSLVICNTVLRAQQLYLQLKEHVGDHGPRVVLLQSRFEAEQRKKLSEEIEHELGPEQWEGDSYHGQDLIVVATQVVEVGLDISVRTLHTEIAPANSLIQRAGRCARFKQQQGKVIVYPLPTDADGKPASTLPYDEESCKATWRALAESYHKQVLGFVEEQQLINAVHTTEDTDLLDRYERNKSDITRSIFQSLNTNDRSISSTLIRDVLQVPILIHDDPNNEITSEPWKWQSFAMHPASLAGRWQALQERKAELGLDWMCKQAVAVKVDDPDNIDNQQKITYTWQEVTNPTQLSTALMVALPSELASYYEDLGFTLLDGRLKVEPGTYQSTKREANKSKSRGEGSRQQSYQEHIYGLVQAYNWNISRELQYIADQLEQKMGLPSAMVDQAIRLAIACHDLGKLDRIWQHWAREWQKLLKEHQNNTSYQLPNQTYFFAKTDFDYRSPEQRELQKNVKTKRPHHACESVMLGRNLIAASLDVKQHKERLPLLKAICGAIARHHTPRASNFGVAQLDISTKQAIEEALRFAQQDQQWSYDLSQLNLNIPEGGDLAPESALTPKLTRPASGPQSELETWLYFTIVRALRLADQRAGIFS